MFVVAAYDSAARQTGHRVCIVPLRRLLAQPFGVVPVVWGCTYLDCAVGVIGKHECLIRGPISWPRLQAYQHTHTHHADSIPVLPCGDSSNGLRSSTLATHVGASGSVLPLPDTLCFTKCVCWSTACVDCNTARPSAPCLHATPLPVLACLPSPVPCDSTTLGASRASPAFPTGYAVPVQSSLVVACTATATLLWSCWRLDVVLCCVCCVVFLLCWCLAELVTGVLCFSQEPCLTHTRTDFTHT